MRKVKTGSQGERGGFPLWAFEESRFPNSLSLHPHDLFRIIRALEVFDSTGVPISFLSGTTSFWRKTLPTLKVGLETNRDRLYHRIEKRVDQMIEKGFLQEVKRLMEMGYGPELKPMQSLGYKQMVQFLLKEIGMDRGCQTDEKGYTSLCEATADMV